MQAGRLRYKGQTHPACLVVRPSRPHMQAGRLRYKDNDRRPQSAWRRRVHRRCLASRHDVVLNVISACLASSRGSDLNNGAPCRRKRAARNRARTRARRRARRRRF